MIDLYVDSGSLPLFSIHKCKKLKGYYKSHFFFFNVGNYNTCLNRIWQFYKNVQINKSVSKDVVNSTSSKANCAWQEVQSIASRMKYWHQVQEIPFLELAKCSAHILKTIFFGNVINLNKNLTRMQHMDKTRHKYITMLYLWFQLASLSCWNSLRKVNLLHTQYNSFLLLSYTKCSWRTGQTSGVCSTGHLEQKM